MRWQTWCQPLGSPGRLDQLVGSRRQANDLGGHHQVGGPPCVAVTGVYNYPLHLGQDSTGRRVEQRAGVPWMSAP